MGTSLPDGTSTDNVAAAAAAAAVVVVVVVVVIIIIIIRNGLIPSPIGSNPHNSSRSLNQTCNGTDQLAYSTYSNHDHNKNITSRPPPMRSTWLLR